jgi:glycosyltransferase involved in cell wall biosynthesis
VIETGFVPDEMMPAYYSLADVYVSPSLMEGFGLPLGEALACGTPVVAFDAGAVAEVVGPGGILVPPRDVKGLAEAVSYLLQNPDIRNSMAAKGRDHIVREFSVSKMLEATLEAYERFLDVKRSL